MFTLPELPYPPDALEPWISRETLDYHHGKHHAAYVKNLNELVQGSDYASLPLEELVRVSANRSGTHSPVFKNAAQAWNHAFYWQCMTPDRHGPGGHLADALNTQFGSVEGFQQRFSQAALGNFGSGWTWLVGTPGERLEIINTSNADTPLTGEATPLLACDVWEHAYYIDYRNARADYIQAFWAVVNWGFVEAGLNRLHRSPHAA